MSLEFKKDDCTAEVISMAFKALKIDEITWGIKIKNRSPRAEPQGTSRFSGRGLEVEPAKETKKEWPTGTVKTETAITWSKC